MEFRIYVYGGRHKGWGGKSNRSFRSLAAAGAFTFLRIGTLTIDGVVRLDHTGKKIVLERSIPTLPGQNCHAVI